MSGRRAAGFLLLAAALVLGACARSSDVEFQGWVEADLIFVSADEQGRLETELVREGDKVVTGALLFTLDADLQKADVTVADATLANARQAFDRAQQLLKTNAGTQKDFDIAQAALRQAEAQLNWAQTRLVRRRMLSPVAGTVQQIYFRPGEMVTAGRPVVALLPPGNVKIRFFVPEAKLPRIAIGDSVNVTCDGCASGLTAKISFISPTSEFTPPVIYSLEERAKLVFMVEARPDAPDAFRVGQPLTVTLVRREASR
jgi:HlyD family secretion protein